MSPQQRPLSLHSLCSNATGRWCSIAVLSDWPDVCCVGGVWLTIRMTDDIRAPQSEVKVSRSLSHSRLFWNKWLSMVYFSDTSFYFPWQKETWLTSEIMHAAGERLYLCINTVTAVKWMCCYWLWVPKLMSLQMCLGPRTFFHHINVACAVRVTIRHSTMFCSVVSFETEANPNRVAGL